MSNIGLSSIRLAHFTRLFPHCVEVALSGPPQAMNALSKNLVGSLQAAIDAVKFDKAVRVLIIRLHAHCTCTFHMHMHMHMHNAQCTMHNAQCTMHNA